MREERTRRPTVARCGPAPRRHLDQCVGPALPGGAGKVGGHRLPTQFRPGGGPVGFEHLAFDALQLVTDDGTRDRIERDAPQPHAVEAALEIDVASIASLLVVEVGTVGVSQLLPVGDRSREGLESECGRLIHEHRLVANEGVLGRGADEGR